jgi:hypothetical protein
MMPTKFANGGPVRFLDIKDDYGNVFRTKDIFDFQKGWSKDKTFTASNLTDAQKSILMSIEASDSPMLRLDMNRAAGKKAWERWERDMRLFRHYSQPAIDTNKPIIINSVV